jgi:hypothetical protein
MQKIDFKDYPDTSTLINAENLKTIQDNVEISINEVDAKVVSGWYEIDSNSVPTFTFVSWDSTTYTGVVSTNIDLTPYLSVGMKVKFTQNSAIKYAFITAITSTQLTLFLGTDYSLNSSAISNSYYSMLKAPYGFPLEESKWSIILVDSNDRAQISPTTNVFYNLGSLSITIPQGLFRIYTNINLQVGISGDPLESRYAQYTLSTTTNSITNSEFNIGIAGYGTFYRSLQFKRNIISLNSKTTFYLLMRILAGSYNLYFGGVEIPTKIQAVCAYL